MKQAGKISLSSFYSWGNGDPWLTQSHMVYKWQLDLDSRPSNPSLGAPPYGFLFFLTCGKHPGLWMKRTEFHTCHLLAVWLWTSYLISLILVFLFQMGIIIFLLPRWHGGKESACQGRRHKRHRFDPWVWKIPCIRKWQPTLVFLPGEFHGQKSLVGSMESQRVGQNWVTNT